MTDGKARFADAMAVANVEWKEVDQVQRAAYTALAKSAQVKALKAEMKPEIQREERVSKSATRLREQQRRELEHNRPDDEGEQLEEIGFHGATEPQHLGKPKGKESSRLIPHNDPEIGKVFEQRRQQAITVAKYNRKNLVM